MRCIFAPVGRVARRVWRIQLSLFCDQGCVEALAVGLIGLGLRPQMRKEKAQGMLRQTKIANVRFVQ